VVSCGLDASDEGQGTVAGLVNPVMKAT